MRCERTKTGHKGTQDIGTRDRRLATRGLGQKSQALLSKVDEMEPKCGMATVTLVSRGATLSELDSMSHIKKQERPIWATVTRTTHKRKQVLIAAGSGKCNTERGRMRSRKRNARQMQGLELMTLVQS